MDPERTILEDDKLLFSSFVNRRLDISNYPFFLYQWSIVRSSADMLLDKYRFPVLPNISFIISITHNIKITDNPIK